MLARVFSLVLTKIIVELALEFDAIGLNKRFGKQCRQRTPLPDAIMLVFAITASTKTSCTPSKA